MKLPRFFRDEPGGGSPSADPDAKLKEKLDRARRHMIDADLAGRDIRDPRVLEAMRRVPRHLFVGEDLVPFAYDDSPLDIGHGQTISQPYIVAKMTELLLVNRGDRVLEIGAGCGYQSAVLMELGVFVYCVEIIPELADEIEGRLTGLGYKNFRVSCRDGRLGWPEFAPYDAVLLAAAPAELPRTLLDQVHIGGRIVAPIGHDAEQFLTRWIRRQSDRWDREEIFSVRFVPMTQAGD